MKTHHLLIIGVGAAVLGFILANANSGTGIYATPVGQTLANLYVQANTAGGGLQPANS